jgi:eukaryotic-like serine/threonine-protein kinase
LNEGQVMHAMCIDDVYHVDRTLAQGPGGTTELVSIGKTGPFVRKKIPLQLAHRRVWAALSECKSPRLPNVEITYELPDMFVIVYDYVPGETLEDRVACMGRLDAEEAARLAGQICEAVQTLHEHGIFHRDLSPTNIVVAADGAHLIDLGIARMHRENTSRDTTPLGTYGFAAPEQYGFAQSDERTDVYSIGRLLGYMLTGAKPNEEDGEYDKRLADEGVVPAWLRCLVEKACSFEPSARYQTAAEMAAALESKDAGETVAKVPGADAGTVAHATKSGNKQSEKPSENRGNRGPMVAVAVVILALLALSIGLGIGWFAAAQDDVAEEEPKVESSAEKDAADSASAAKKETVDSSGNNASVATETKANATSANENDDAATSQFSDAAGSSNSETSGGSATASNSSGTATKSGTGQASSTSSKDTAPSATSTATSSTGTGSSAVATGATIEPVSSSSSGSSSILELGETYWAMDDFGNLSFVFELKNTSSNTKVLAPQVTITARNAAGEILLSQQSGVMYVYAGQSAWYSGSYMISEEPASVDFAIDPLITMSGGKAATYAVDNIHIASDTSWSTTITGDITCTAAGDTDPIQAALTLVFRDEDGNIVGGTFGVVTSPAEGQSSSFSINVYDDLPEDYASYEVYAQVW